MFSLYNVSSFHLQFLTGISAPRNFFWGFEVHQGCLQSGSPSRGHREVVRIFKISMKNEQTRDNFDRKFAISSNFLNFYQIIREIMCNIYKKIEICIYKTLVEKSMETYNFMKILMEILQFLKIFEFYRIFRKISSKF